MTLYRKKPVQVEAWQFKPNEQMPSWCEGLVSHTPPFIFADIDNQLSMMRAYPGDWIIRGVKGEIYPVKPDIFDATYEKVES